MKKELYNYIDEVNNILESDKKYDYDEILKTHLERISFFQHERLVHLIVTVFYALFTILFLFLAIINVYFWIIVFILLIFLFFYVIFYFKLENGVQYLYKQYDKLKLKEKKMTLF